MKSRVFTITSLLAVAFAMFASASAIAQTTPGEDVYNPVGEVLNVVQGGGSDTAPAAGTQAEETVPVESGSSPAAPTVASGELPFTGFEAGLVAMAGLALLGAGMAMRRVSRSDDAA